MRLNRWKMALLIGWTGFATGISFLFLAIGFAAYEGWFLKQSSVTQGIVIANVQTETRVNPETAGLGQGSFCPQFQYKTPDGVTRVQTSLACSNPPRFSVGDRVRINYLRSNPANGQMDSFGAKWGLVLGFGIAALVLTTIGIVVLARLRLRGQSLDPLEFWT
jgi:hypothetical protein